MRIYREKHHVLYITKHGLLSLLLFVTVLLIALTLQLLFPENTYGLWLFFIDLFLLGLCVTVSVKK